MSEAERDACDFRSYGERLLCTGGAHPADGLLLMTDYEKICDFQNLYKAHKAARLGKRDVKEVIEFELNLAKNLTHISDSLRDKTYQMTAEEVRNSTWGEPQKINTTITANHTTEQWCYSNYRYVYLENGIVTSIQK